MLKEIKTVYRCEICQEPYESEEEARICEARPVTQNIQFHSLLKRGDLVKITNGDSKGRVGRVLRSIIFSRWWGHYAADRYWHTIGYEVEVVEFWGQRLLTFDDYGPI